jgi:ankyrin repeat protein
MTTVPCRPRAQDGWTALIYSASFGHVEVARLLLDSRADIHAAKKVRRAAQGVRTRPANMLRLG